MPGSFHYQEFLHAGPMAAEHITSQPRENGDQPVDVELEPEDPIVDGKTLLVPYEGHL